MPNWKNVLDEITSAGSTHDIYRRQYLEKLHNTTGRNTIIYYSGWLQKPGAPGQSVMITDSDMAGFMSAVNKMTNRQAGLDLVLHTPGGLATATESLVGYLRKMFGTDIRVIVPQLAMSAGTLMALAAREVVMAKHSSLGPIDPQINGIPAHSIIQEIDQAKSEMQANPASQAYWQIQLSKYPPAFVFACKNQVKLAEDMGKKLLMSGMLLGNPNAASIADTIVQKLGDHGQYFTHDRHISIDEASSFGLVVKDLESDPALQDAVLTVHHATMLTLSVSPAVKIIENHFGSAYIQNIVM